MIYSKCIKILLNIFLCDQEPDSTIEEQDTIEKERERSDKNPNVLKILLNFLCVSRNPIVLLRRRIQ